MKSLLCAIFINVMYFVTIDFSLIYICAFSNMSKYVQNMSFTFIAASSEMQKNKSYKMFSMLRCELRLVLECYVALH